VKSATKVGRPICLILIWLTWQGPGSLGVIPNPVPLCRCGQHHTLKPCAPAVMVYSGPCKRGLGERNSTPPYVLVASAPVDACDRGQGNLASRRHEPRIQDLPAAKVVKNAQAWRRSFRSRLWTWSPWYVRTPVPVVVDQADNYRQDADAAVWLVRTTTHVKQETQCPNRSALTFVHLGLRIGTPAVTTRGFG